jgi:hypothetical protein
MSLSGTVTSADPTLVSTLPGNHLPIYGYIEKIYKVIILYGNINLYSDANVAQFSADLDRTT